MRMRTRLVWQAALIACLLLFTASAFADGTQFVSSIDVANCSSPNCLSSLTTGPYGTVTVDLVNSTTANVTFQAASGYLFGDSSVVDVNVNATNFGTSNLVGGTGFAFGGSGNVDGFGTFNATFSQDDGWSNALGTLSFTLTNNTSTWAAASDVLSFNPKNFDAAAHIFVCTDASCTSQEMANGTGLTGFAAEGTGHPTVPEPASLVLVGTGLLALGTFGRRRMES